MRLCTESKGSKAIVIWKFKDAPKKYQKLSGNGGDEDWLAIIPKNLWKKYEKEDHYPDEGKFYYEIPYFIDNDSFGCFNREFHELDKNYLVVIGSHS
jgi:hypothetical protein